MNRLLFIFATLALALASCSSKQEAKENIGKQEQDSLCFAMGYKSADAIRTQASLFPDTMTFKSHLLIKGFIDGLKNDTSVNISAEEADMLLISYHEYLNRQKYKENISEGNAFFAEYAKKEGVVKFSDFILYRVKKQGNGIRPTEYDNIIINYEGKDATGTTFEIFKKDKVVYINDFIDCLGEVIMQMPEGSEWEIVYSPTLFNEFAFFGKKHNVKPYSALVYNVELKKVVK